MRLQEIPRHPLTFGPSPLQHLRRLSDHLGGAQVWAKREDVNSGLAYGGNKIRKLEYIVPDVLASGADTLVSIGGYQSNHTRQVAAVAAHLGLKCRLVQEKWVPWDDPVNDKVGNILLSRMMGADSRLDPRGFDIGIRDSWKDALREVEEAGGTPYPIPAGRIEHPLGGVGFANWAFEVAEQEKALGVHFDTIVVCTVTCSTHAGMVAGFAALEDLTGDAAPGHRDRRIRDAREDPRPARAHRPAHGRGHRARPRPARRRVQLLERLGGRPLRHPRRLDDGGHAPGRRARGDDHRPGLRGEVAGRASSTSSAGGDIPRGSTVLYAHLGGQPAINAYHSLWPGS